MLFLIYKSFEKKKFKVKHSLRTFNTRAPKAVRAVKNFARKEFHTSDVRLDVNLNKFLWSSGIRNVPKRVRVRITRLRNEDEEAKEKMYSLVTLVPVTDFKGLQTINVDVSE